MYPRLDEIVTKRNVWVFPRSELDAEDEWELHWSDLRIAEDASRHQRQYLTKSMQEFFTAYLKWLDNRSGGINATTVKSNWSRLNTFVSWMTIHEIWRMNQVTRSDIVSFLISPDSRKGKIRSVGTINAYITLFGTLWRLRAQYTAPLKVNPWGINKDRTIRGLAIKNEQWKPVPDFLAIPLIDSALTWLEQYGELTVEISNRVWALRKRQLGKARGARLVAAHKEYESISLLCGFKPLAIELKATHKKWGAVVRRAITTTQDAVLTLVLFLVGMRISEVFSLRANCLMHKRLEDGTEVSFIQGIAAKRHGMRKEWVVPESVRRGIDLLARLHEQQRTGGNFRYLFICANGIVAGADKKTRRVSAARGPRMMRRFAKLAFRTKKWPKRQRLHSHAARKSFASMVMRRDKNALGALANHFGHVRDRVTAGTYGGGDLELAQMLQEEDRKDLARGLTDLLTSTNIAGHVASTLTAARAAVGDLTGFRGKRALEAMVEDLISKGVVLAPCYWGYCVYSRMHSACHGDDLGPNPVERCPDVCASCKNFGVTETHRSFWEQRHARDESFLNSHRLPEQTILVVRRHLVHSESVLASLNENTKLRSAS